MMIFTFYFFHPKFVSFRICYFLASPVRSSIVIPSQLPYTKIDYYYLLIFNRSEKDVQSVFFGWSSMTKAGSADDHG